HRWSRYRQRPVWRALRQVCQSFAQIKDSALVQPRSCIEQTYDLALLVAPRHKEAWFDAMRNVSRAVCVQVVCQLQQIPRVAAACVRSVRGAYRPAEARGVIQAMPHPVLPPEMPRAPFLGFASHHVNAPLFQSMKGHHIWRIVDSTKPALLQTIHQAGWRM